MIANEKQIAGNTTDVFGASLSRRGFVRAGGALMVGFGLVKADGMRENCRRERQHSRSRRHRNRGLKSMPTTLS